MTLMTGEYLEAIEHLPVGGKLTLYDVPWEEYEQLLDDLGDGYKVRVTYAQGRLEIMSPLPSHEKYKDTLLRLADVVATATGSDLETFGSTTCKRQEAETGAEPDTCFYVQNAARVIGRDRFDLTVDPPPDVVVEIDVTSQSFSKCPIYADLGVPEIWHYDEAQVRIYRLSRKRYVESRNSRAFPVLTSASLTQFMELSKTQGQSATLREFRQWVRQQAP